jgi:hypothetical protein
VELSTFIERVCQEQERVDYASPDLVELGDLAELTSYSVSVRVP